MRDDTTIAFTDPAFADALSDLVRDGAQRIIKQAVQAELNAFLQTHADRDADGRRAVVRNGYQPERDVLTGVGPVAVALPKDHLVKAVSKFRYYLKNKVKIDKIYDQFDTWGGETFNPFIGPP